MSEERSWEERRYAEVFAQVLRLLELRRVEDPHFTPTRLREFLQDAYFRQESDWIGHGLVFDITQAAIIAAYEQFLAAWEAEAEEV